MNCPDCDGLGYTETTPDQPDCPTCRGSGRVLLNSEVYECPDCRYYCADWEPAP